MKATLTYSNKQEPCVVCASALKITAQGTIHQLHLEIKKVLEALPFVRCFHGFEVSEHSDKADGLYRMNAYSDQNESDVSYPTDQALTHKALHSNETQYLEQDEGWLCIIPVKNTDGREGLWLLDCEKGEGIPNLKSVWQLLRIYENCVSHIGLQNTDPLTGLENRQALSDRLSRVLKGSRRSNDSGSDILPCICILDIDFFKRVNDDYGHLYGDEVLLLFAGLMKKTFREHDFLYRYGGEEFVVLLDSPTLEESVIALERFRSVVDTYVFPQVGHIAVSIGFVHMSMGELPSSALDKADKALYYSKENGRNQVNSYQNLLSKGLIVEEKLKIDSELF